VVGVVAIRERRVRHLDATPARRHGADAERDAGAVPVDVALETAGSAAASGGHGQRQRGGGGRARGGAHRLPVYRKPAAMTVRLYNTLTQKVEPFEPLVPG